MRVQQACITLFAFIALITFLLLPLESIEAALGPEELVVLVNADSPESVRIGRLYSLLRKVPASHLIKVRVARKDGVSRKDYDELIAGPARRALNELFARGAKIRCIVTTYGIPLRIRAAGSLLVSEEEISRYVRMKKEKKERLAGLEKEKREGRALGRVIRKLRAEVNKLSVKIIKLKGYKTIAAVDSELAMLLVRGYELEGWQLNPEFLYNRGKISYPGQTLMVSRLDAPTPELTEGLIRIAIEVEKTGLAGNIYLDARGITDKDDAYSRFDEDIRRTARILRKGLMPVVLDNRPELFGPGDAPLAALYCGWYSLEKYIDAFGWVRGAVGYHVASFEARSLHDTKSKYWVKSMIEKGVIGTIGPVAEPYLTAFPPPTLFFPLLMTGNYTLAEVFAMTNPLLSWRMILIGDPLYNPFKKRPAIFIRNLPAPPK